jgi:hypothetical protein
VLFKTVCDTYDLLPADNYKLPPEAEGLEPVEEVKAPAPSILKPDTPPTQSTEEFLQVGRTNTRRHIRPLLAQPSRPSLKQMRKNLLT